jgi:DNA-binding XRE family transcriptional regulator
MFTKISIAVIALAAPVASVQTPAPQPVVLVSKVDMPQFLPTARLKAEFENAVSIYHQLRKEFALSNTAMSKWLGIKRRTLYNWINEPLKSRKYSSQIESRLATLSKLKEEMEPEHYGILHKIAFSPIYGNPEFGEMILSGASDIVLVEYYDELFSQFESYRQLNANKIDIA